MDPSSLFPDVVSEAMEAIGVEPCVFTVWTAVPHVALLLLFASLFYRYRAVIWKHRYDDSGRAAPKFTFTAVPYEAVVALLLGLPRAWSTVSVVPSDFTLDSLRTALLTDFSWLHWTLLTYIVVLDLYERRQWFSKTLVPYYESKARSADLSASDAAASWLSKEAKEDSRLTASPAADLERADGDADSADVYETPRSMRQRFLAAFARRRQHQGRLDAVHIAVTYQIMALAKLVCANVFLLNASTFSCLAGRSREGNLGGTLPWSAITIVSAARGLALMMEGYAFARQERVGSTSSCS